MNKQKFDFIIVGAGSAGCVLANRLSACGKHSVLLLEAGPKDNYLPIHIPVTYSWALENQKMIWQYDTLPENKTSNRSHFYPRGKVLGGSSSVNGMLYVRGQPQDYDTWGKDWGWKDIVPYFKKSEHYQGEETEFHGKGGPLHVSFIEDKSLLSDAIIDAGLACGLPYNDDVNDGDQLGIGYFNLTTKNGQRCSSAKAFLTPIKNRNNLTIITDAQVQKLEFEQNRCTGVKVDCGGTTTHLKANKEVIVSCGAIASPQLLQVSGVGCPELLKKIDVNLVHANPYVGKNLAEHYLVILLYRLNTNIGLNAKLRGLSLVWQSLKYFFTRSGALANSAVHVQAYIKSKLSKDRPDIQLHFFPFSPKIDPKKTVQTELEKEPGMMLSINQLRPESRGHIEAISSDMCDNPHIKPNFLASELDQKTLVEGVKEALKLIKQPHIANYIKSDLVGAETWQNDDDILNHVKEYGATMYHSIGTCKMGEGIDAVVDFKLKVKGVDNLRVADASIMPEMPSGNTNAPTIMIGEKCADLVLKEWL